MVDSRRQEAADMRLGITVAGNNGNDSLRGAVAGPGKSGAANSGSTSGSTTVIKLKRHGGAGSSSLARAVQQQLAQRKAAAVSGQTVDETRSNGSIPVFRVASSPYRDAGYDLGASVGASALHLSGSGSTSDPSRSSTVDFTDPLKQGVTGRGPIKSRRKSIAKGLDQASALATHSGNILGTSPVTAPPGALLGIFPPISQIHPSSGASEVSLGFTSTPKPKAATTKKPRKKKEVNEDETTATQGTGRAGRGKGGFGLGKGKGGSRPIALGLGKGKGGAYRQELLRRAEMEEFDDESDEEGEEASNFQINAIDVSSTGGPPGLGNGMVSGNGRSFSNDNSALAYLANSALERAQQQQQQQQQKTHVETAKSRKQPRKGALAKPSPVRKFGGKSFGMAGGESSGSTSNESSDGEGTGSSGSQSDSSSSGMSGSNPGDSD